MDRKIIDIKVRGDKNKVEEKTKSNIATTCGSTSYISQLKNQTKVFFFQKSFQPHKVSQQKAFSISPKETFQKKDKDFQENPQSLFNKFQNYKHLNFKEVSSQQESSLQQNETQSLTQEIISQQTPSSQQDMIEQLKQQLQHQNKRYQQFFNNKYFRKTKSATTFTLDGVSYTIGYYNYPYLSLNSIEFIQKPSLIS